MVMERLGAGKNRYMAKVAMERGNELQTDMSKKHHCADRKKAAFSAPPMLGVLKIRPRRGYVTLSGNTHVGYVSKWSFMSETIYPIPRRDRLVA